MNYYPIGPFLIYSHYAKLQKFQRATADFLYLCSTATTEAYFYYFFYVKHFGKVQGNCDISYIFSSLVDRLARWNEITVQTARTF